MSNITRLKTVVAPYPDTCGQLHGQQFITQQQCCPPATCPPPCPPCPPPWSSVQQCWDMTSEFDKFLQQAIQRLINQGMMPATPVTGPIVGVVDGSEAGVGEVGEFLSGTASATVTVPGTGTNFQVTPLLVPPGDWDLQGFCSLPSTDLAGAWFSPNPAIPAMKGVLYASYFASGSETDITLVSSNAQLSTSAPVMLSFNLGIMASVTSASITYNFSVFARRTR